MVMVKKGVDIEERQQKWLESHPSMNLSGLVREAIDVEIENERILKELGKKKGMM